jgi:DNA-binding transcriptional ArsR family regulator
MPAIADRLHNYATAISDPTRGMILLELDRADELTATHLARRLGLGVNNVYHHMRVLLELGVVDPPRRVPGETYVEKYYRINPELRAAVRLDPAWYNEAQKTMTPEDRQALSVGVCLTMANLLRQTAREYQEMDAERFAQLHDQHTMLLAINRLSRDQLESRLSILRETFAREDWEYAEDVSPRTDLMLLAILPAAHDEGDEQSQ